MASICNFHSGIFRFVSISYITHHTSYIVARTSYFVLVLACCLIGFSSCTALRPDYNPSEKIAPDKLKDDAVLLRKILEADHPSLYWYTPKDSMDMYFDETLNGITDSLTELQFRNKMAKVVAKIRCGHTAVRSSKDYAHFFSIHKIPQFPLVLKAWDDSLVVIASSLKNDTIFKRGTVVTSINGLPNKMVLDSMFQVISTDGYSDNFKYQLVSIYFPLFYNLALGIKDSNIITYKDSTGIEKTAVIRNFRPFRDTSRGHTAGNVPFPKPTRKQIRAARKRNNTVLTFDSANTAYMRLTTFSGAGLRKLFRRSFEEIQQKQSANLVIDLRENGGGNIGVSTNLTRYIIQHPFTTADTVAAVRRNFAYSKYIHPAWIYKTIMFFSAKKKQDGRYHFGYLEHHLYYPKIDLHFNGNVYILQGGFTFSAASMFVSKLKGQQNVTVVGEETGGGNYGNSSVHLPSIILPNSRIEVIMPLYRIVNDSTRIKNGRGIIPDVFVGPNLEAIKNGVDIKMVRVKELIASKKSNTPNKPIER